MGTQAVTVVDLAKKAGEWALAYNLEAVVVPGHQRQNILQNALGLACEAQDDEAALRYFGFLMQEIADENPADAAATASQQAEFASQLWGILPRNHTTEGPNPQPVRVMPKTKATVLDILARGWRDAEITVSDRCFDILASLGRGAAHEIIRGVTDKSFPVDRVVRALMMRVPLDADWVYFDDDLERVLTKAFERNTPVTDLAWMIRATGPLREASRAALQLLERQAREIRALDNLGESLSLALNGREIPSCRMLKIRYPQAGLILVRR